MKNTFYSLAALLLAAALAPVVQAQTTFPVTKTSAAETARLVAVLKSDAPQFDKVVACKQLAVIGTPEAIAPLAALLTDETYSHMARYALESNPSPQVDEALRAALGKAQGKLLVGVMTSIGQRHDKAAVPALAKFLDVTDTDMAATAAMTLGRIAGPEAAEALTAALKTHPRTRKAVADGCLRCAVALAAEGKADEAAKLYQKLIDADVPQYIKVAATSGLLVAQKGKLAQGLAERLADANLAMVGATLRAVRAVPDKDVTAALAAALEKLPAERQILVLWALGDRADPSVTAAVLPLAKTGPAGVRAAAIQTLGKVGDASAAPVIGAAAADAEVAKAAVAALTKTPGDAFDKAAIELLEKSDSALRKTALEIIGQRRIPAAVPALQKAIDDADESVRLAAFRALGENIAPDQIALLGARFRAAKSEAETTALGEALKAACSRAPDREAAVRQLVAALSQKPEDKLALLPILGTVGGDEALKAVAAAARDADPDVQDTATRVLGEWMTPDGAPVLLDIATKHDNPKYKVRAMRGYVRMIRQLDIPPGDKLTMFRTAFPLARPEEQKLLVEVLGRIPNGAALKAVLPYLKDDKLRDAAAGAALAVGEKLYSKQPDLVAKAMQEVLDNVKNRDLAAKAKLLQQKAGKR